MGIRVLRSGDAASLHAIHTACMSKSLASRYTQQRLDAWMSGRTPAGYLRAEAAGEMFLVAEIEGVVVGYVSWKSDELMSLFVDPDWQGRGIGTQLIRECLREAESEGSPIAHIKSVLGAEPFYARFGFRTAGADKDVKQGIEIPYSNMALQS